MSRTDLISDSLTIIRNAGLAKKEDALIPYSSLVLTICDILKKEGYIENYRKIDENKKQTVKVYLKYRNKKNVISRIEKISKPSLRVYVDKSNIPYVLNGRGTAVLSTSKGVFTDKEARKLGVGGEVLLHVW